MITLKHAQVAASAYAYDKQLLIIKYGLVLRSLNVVREEPVLWSQFVLLSSCSYIYRV
jgi:hypothetical protein